jgi:o-succinylbenzoate synthase
MKIARFRIRPYAFPLRAPLRTAHGLLARREGFVIALGNGDGRWGLGEGAPLPGFGMETLGACGEALRRWGRALEGGRPDLSALATGAGIAGLGLPGDPAARPAAAHGLELALLDLAAQEAGLPLARWLQAGAASRVPVNATIGAQPPAAAARLAAALAGEGYGTLKVKVGADDPETDRARLRAVREAVGPAVRLRIDANGAWTRSGALRALEAVAPLAIEYAEQPVPAADLESLAWVTARSPIPVAADEAVGSPEQAMRLLDAGAARVLILKPMALGGLLATLRVVHRAAAQGVPCVITTTIDAAVARTGALHAAAAASPLLPGSPLAFGLATGAMLAEDLLPDAPIPARGELALPVAPGLGLNRAFARAFPPGAPTP